MTGTFWQQHPRANIVLLLAVLSCLFSGCNNSPEANVAPSDSQPANEPTSTLETDLTQEPIAGCDGQIYGDPANSLYVLPFAVGETYRTGLTNCSSSYHSAGNPDQYAFDFDMPLGTPFIAARGGTVYGVVNEEPSQGGGVGNFVIIDHHDGTYGLYYHSPEGGIEVAEGDEVAQGDVLGVTGRSGLAGYPHLHFIVVEGEPSYPYAGIPISFRNAIPADVVLQSRTEYKAGEH